MAILLGATFDLSQVLSVANTHPISPIKASTMHRKSIDYCGSYLVPSSQVYHSDRKIRKASKPNLKIAEGKGPKTGQLQIWRPRCQSWCFPEVFLSHLQGHISA